MKHFNDEIFQQPIHNSEKLATKLPDNPGSQSQAYIPQKIVNNKEALYIDYRLNQDISFTLWRADDIADSPKCEINSQTKLKFPLTR